MRETTRGVCTVNVCEGNDEVGVHKLGSSRGSRRAGASAAAIRGYRRGEAAAPGQIAAFKTSETYLNGRFHADSIPLARLPPACCPVAWRAVLVDAAYTVLGIGIKEKSHSTQANCRSGTCQKDAAVYVEYYTSKGTDCLGRVLFTSATRWCGPGQDERQQPLSDYRKGNNSRETEDRRSRNSMHPLSQIPYLARFASPRPADWPR